MPSMPAASKFAVDRRRQPGAARGVLGVGHDQVDRLLPPQSPQGLRADLPARLADDVADEEQTHRAMGNDEGSE